jgi:hypothetical protein
MADRSAREPLQGHKHCQHVAGDDSVETQLNCPEPQVLAATILQGLATAGGEKKNHYLIGDSGFVVGANGLEPSTSRM